MRRVFPFTIFLLATWLALPGCKAPEPVDPVSQADYRRVVSQVYDNLRGPLRSAMLDALSFDAKHSNNWKSCHLALLDDTAALCSDILAQGEVPR